MVTLESVVDPDVLALCLVGLLYFALKLLVLYDTVLASARRSDGTGERPHG